MASPIPRLSIAGVRANRARFISLIFAVFVGVVFIATTLTITDTVRSSFNTLFANVYKNVTVSVRAKTDVVRFGQSFRDRINADVADVVKNTPGVTSALPTVYGYAYVVNEEGKPAGDPSNDSAAAPVAGNWIENKALNPFTIASGREPRKDGEVVIDTATSRLRNIKIGDTVRVVSKSETTKVKVVGTVRFGSVDSPSGSPVALFTTSYAQQLVGEPGKADAIDVKGDGSVTPEVLAQRIQKLLPKSIEAVTGKQVAQEAQSEPKSRLRFFTAFLLIFSILSLVVGAFIIANTFTISIGQRTKELAMLRAVGMHRAQVRRMVLGEAVIVSVVASSIGLVCGIGLASLLRNVFRKTGVEIPPAPLVVRPLTVALCYAVGVLVTLAAAILPAINAGRTSPVAAMRSSEVEQKPVLWRTVAGFFVAVIGAWQMKTGADYPSFSQTGLGIAILFFGLLLAAPAMSYIMRLLTKPARASVGLTAGLATENATRNPRRTAATALALSLGSAVACLAVVFNASLQQSFSTAITGGYKSDLYIRSGAFGFGGLPPTLAKKIQALPGVEAASGTRIGFAVVDGPKRKPRKPSAVTRVGGRPIAALDPSTADIFFDFGNETGNFATLGKSTVSVSQRELDSHGWNPGDVITMKFPGKAKTKFTISHIYRQGLAFDFAIGQNDFEPLVNDQFDFLVNLKGKPGVDNATLRLAVEKVAVDYPTAKIENRQEYVQRLGDSLDQLLKLIVGLLVLVVIVAMTGIAITLSLGIFERTREIGLLRTLGMFRSQVKSMVRWEAVVISLFAVSLGVAFGTAVSWALLRALRSEGLVAFVVPYFSLVMIAVSAALAGLVAAALPARRAARLPMLGALQHV
jgi:putative ABC transport system permease protein